MSDQFVTREYFDEQINILKALIVAQVVHPDWITVSEACKLINRSRTTITKFITEGKLVAEQISPRKKRISYVSLMALKKVI